MAAERVWGLWPCSANNQPNPVDLPRREFYACWESHQGDTGQSYPNQGLEEEIPRIQGGLLATVLVWCHKDILRSVGSSIREHQRRAERPQLLKSTGFV